MTPRARTHGIDVVEQDGGLLIRDRASRAEHVLHPLTAFVWKHADGATGIDELAGRAGAALNCVVTEDQVWAAIDVLTGARLLEDRIAPPAGTQRVARRDLLRTVAVGSAAAAALGVVTAPASAQSDKAQESVKKVAQESAEKASQETREKSADLKAQREDARKAVHEAKEDASKAQENVNKAQHSAKEDAAKAAHEAKENANKAAEQSSKSAHEQENKAAAEERGKNQNPFNDIILEADWENIAEGYARLTWERRGPHVHLAGLIEFAGTPEFAEPPDPSVPTEAPGPKADPPDPDSDEFDMETMLIGRLPEGARPPATLAFSVASDSIHGASEVLITSAGEILLVVDDETDDQLDAALAMLVPPIDPNSETKVPPDSGVRACLRKVQRRRRRLARARHRQARRLLRKRARQARRRCLDGQEVLLTGPSEISFSGISFRVAD